MTIATLEQSLRDGDHRLLDTTSLIAYFDQGEQISPLAMHLVDELVFSGRNAAVISMVSVTEVLVRPLRRGATDPYHHMMDFLTGFPNFGCCPSISP
jgi:hypothetical protein